MVKVLLVEEDEQQADMMTSLLETKGAETDSTSPEEAGELSEGYDVLVSDYSLPGSDMTGIQVFEHADEGPKKILYTGYTEDSPEIEGTDVDYVHVTKPGLDRLYSEIFSH